MATRDMMSRMAQGWNTWNTRSVLSHVLLPEGLALSLGVKNYQTGRVTLESLIGRFGDHEEKIHPGPRSYDGAYTELNWKQDGLELLVQSAVMEGEQHLLVTPLHRPPKKAPALLVGLGMLWNRPGAVRREGNTLQAELPTRTVNVFADGEPIQELNTGITGPYFSLCLDRPVAVSTGSLIDAGRMAELMVQARATLTGTLDSYGDMAELYSAMRTCVAWDTIYEPEKDQVCTPVSRLWNINWGGYVLFCWDTYFAAMLAMVDNEDLACANAVAITREMTERGFIPNFAGANDYKSRDRSQPPVGSLAVREIYRRWRTRWLVEELFDDLLLWNRWWRDHRMTADHVLCWGSHPYEPHLGADWERNCVGDTAGAALESGLDNSPMYDGVPFDSHAHLMCLADVGLTGIYVLDCECLADLARVLGRPEEGELREQAELVKQGLETLWDEKTGIYQNKRTDTGKFHRRLSPTNFYALFSDRVSAGHAERMIREHFYNPQEFWGDFILPAITRNDPAYPDQDYWRGRIWAPVNFLAYLAMRKHGLEEPCRDLANKSAALLLQEWRGHGHVHENYSGDTGWGCGVHNSDKFYHWGALLSLIALIDGGIVKGPEELL